MSDKSYVFECTECGEQWVDPYAPVTGHYCDWHGHGMPPQDLDPADVEIIQSPNNDD